MHTYYTQVGTLFAHLALAHDLLGEHEQRLLRSMASVNSNGGAVHPLIHTHVRSGRPSLFLHLAMTGAVIHVASREPSGHHSSTGGAGEAGRTGLEEDALTRGKSSPVQPGPVEWTALDDEEVASLLTRVSEVLSDRRAAYHHSYTAGDLILIDNWAVAHRAFPGSYDLSRGVRVVHRTTVKSPNKLLPPEEWQMPDAFPQIGRPPEHLVSTSPGRTIAWVEGYVGLRWRACEAIDLAGDRSAPLVMMQTPCYADGGFDAMPEWLQSARSSSRQHTRRVHGGGGRNDSGPAALWMRALQ